jgi:hypothetical protein
MREGSVHRDDTRVSHSKRVRSNPERGEIMKKFPLHQPLIEDENVWKLHRLKRLTGRPMTKFLNEILNSYFNGLGIRLSGEKVEGLAVELRVCEWPVCGRFQDSELGPLEKSR